MVKLAKYKDKERILKAPREKRSLTYKDRHIKTGSRPVHRDLASRKGVA